MKTPLPTAKQIPTILKAGLAAESTRPFAEAVALTVVDTVEDMLPNCLIQIG